MLTVILPRCVEARHIHDMSAVDLCSSFNPSFSYVHGAKDLTDQISVIDAAV